MEPNELADNIENLIIAANEVFSKSVVKVQEKLYDAVFLKLRDLELDDQGYIKQNAANRRILLDAESQVEAIISGAAYTAAVTKHVDVIPKINKLNTAYFQDINEGFTPNKNFLKALQSQTIRNINQIILGDGLKAQVQIPLNQILEQNVSTGGAFKGMLEQVKNFIEGSKTEGRLLRYSKIYLRDTLFQYSRSFQESVTSDLGLDWYSYSGGKVDNTRDFCLERTGKFFHRKEIESWASLSWKGKIPGTTESSIFVLLGGFSCGHSLIPVSKLIVPQEDISRIE
jgi:hypothetical protein